MVRLQLCHPNTNTITNKLILRLVESDPTSNMNTNVFPVKHNTSTNTNDFVNKPPKPLREVMKLMENNICSITHPNRSLTSNTKNLVNDLVNNLVKDLVKDFLPDTAMKLIEKKDVELFVNTNVFVNNFVNKRNAMPPLSQKRPIS